MAFYTINLDVDEGCQDLLGCSEDIETKDDKDTGDVVDIHVPDVEFKGEIKDQI